MPPAAATVAGRRVVRDTEAEYVPRAPRRTSGPVREPPARPEPRHRARPATPPSSRATAAAVALETALAPSPSRTREAPAPGRPRREAPSRTRAKSQRRARTNYAPRLALRLQPPRLDRIVRGRAWIPVLGVLLVAIVGLRVEVLKLGAGVGSEVQQATALQSSNAALRSQISALSDNQRITSLAASYGWRMPNALDEHFLQASAGRHVGAAIRNISPPARQTFLPTLASEEQADQLATQAGASLSATGAQTTTSTGSSSGASGTPNLSTTDSTDSGTSSTSTAGYDNTSGLSISGTSTGATAATATGTATPGSSTGSTATGSSTTGTGVIGTGDTGSASLGTDSTGATSGATSSTASTDGAAGLAG